MQEVSWEVFESKMRVVVERLGHFPTRKELEAAGQGVLSRLARKHFSGLIAVALRMGCVPPTYPDGYWEEWSHVEEALRKLFEKTGSFPTDPMLQKEGMTGLAFAIRKYHGGISAVRARMGVPADRVDVGYWCDFDHVAEKLRSMMDETGEFPTAPRLKEAGYSGMIRAIHDKHGGLAAVRRRMGVVQSRAPIGHWLKVENVCVAVERWVQIHGSFPSAVDLRRTNHAGLATSIVKYHGGFPALRVRMGYAPVTDRDIADHADTLAVIVPQLCTPTSVLWAAMKARWTIRDLDAAVDAYNANGSLHSFRTLLRR
jgi:hypothetical protein